jgi:hypothetical protein
MFSFVCGHFEQNFSIRFVSAPTGSLVKKKIQQKVSIYYMFVFGNLMYSLMGKMKLFIYIHLERRMIEKKRRTLIYFCHYFPSFSFLYTSLI